ncbi:MAG TPA: 1-deoxy-D-xylulose-5-phosphate synthase N-terminal domain-containing protein [Patescibacteria group bacterium]
MAKFSLKSLSKIQKDLRKRVLEISFHNNFSHLGSCLSAIDLIYSIYKVKKTKDIFVLSNGHAGVAYYTILEKFGYIKDKNISEKLYVHPDRSKDLGIHVSSGSLGQGFAIALGMALSDKKKSIYCMISDGESTEGSIWETLNIAVKFKIHNLTLVVNANGWSAYDKVNLSSLLKKLKGFGAKVIEIDGHSDKKIIKALKKSVNGFKVIYAYTNSGQLPFLKDLDAHYYTMTTKDYEIAQKLLS